MKTIRNILLLVLGLAMIQSQASAASKHYLVEGKGKRYLVETEGKAKKGKGGGGERPLVEKLPNGFKIDDHNGATLNLTGAIELHRLVLKGYDLEKRKDELTSTIIESTCAVDRYPSHFKEVTPLMAACYAGNSKAAALLLSKGADPNKATKEIIEIEFDELLHPILNATILSWAASNGYFEAVITPLYSAAESGYTDIVRSLLEGGADPNMGLRSTDEHGGVDVRTPMNVAAERGYTEVVISLLEGGARQDLDTESLGIDDDDWESSDEAAQ